MLKRSVTLVAALAGACLALTPPQAGAQTPATCQIAQYELQLRPGEVLAYGDLRIRGAQVGTDQNATIVVDIKAPGFALNQATFRKDTFLRYTICGQDVTITMTWPSMMVYPMFRVSVF